jgi:hypothetical protein
MKRRLLEKRNVFVKRRDRGDDSWRCLNKIQDSWYSVGDIKEDGCGTTRYREDNLDD